MKIVAEVGKIYKMLPPRKGRMRLPRIVLEVRAGTVKTATIPNGVQSAHREWLSRAWFEQNIEKEIWYDD